MGVLRIIFGMLVSPLPSPLQVAVYRTVFGYQIGKRVKFGFGTALIGVTDCFIGNDVHIGHFNLFWNIRELDIGDHTRIGFCNLFRGGAKVKLGDYVSILRCNVFNAIMAPVVVNPIDSTLVLGTGVFVGSSHRFDFTDRIEVGRHTILGGRNSSFWSHNRQRTRPIAIAEHCYVGSETRFAPGAQIGPFCIVALGAVIMERFNEPRSLVGGNPAGVLRPLKDRDLFLTIRKTRADIPDAVVTDGLPSDVTKMYEATLPN